MTLNREYRDIVSSRWRGGSVWYLDYSSLEPRTFFGSVKGESLSSGFYRTLAEKIIGDSGESARAKQMFLRSFYGATSGTVAAGDEFELRHAKSMIKFVEEDFGVKESTKALLEGHRYLQSSGGLCDPRCFDDRCTSGIRKVCFSFSEGRSSDSGVRSDRVPYESRIDFEET